MYLIIFLLGLNWFYLLKVLEIILVKLNIDSCGV